MTFPDTGVFLCAFDALVFLVMAVALSAAFYLLVRLFWLKGHKRDEVSGSVFVALMIGFICASLPYAALYAVPVYGGGWAKVAPSGSQIVVVGDDGATRVINQQNRLMAVEVCFAWEKCFLEWQEISPPPTSLD